MTLKFPRLTLAEGTAEQVLRDMGLASLPIDPIGIAMDKDISVEAAPPTTTGFSGMLAQWDTNFGIMYATYIPSEGFQRFSVGHELGHYFLPGHVEQLLAAGPHRSHAGFGSRDPYEQEADFFAAALLMPRSLLKPILNRHEDGLEVIRAMAAECNTSLTASAVRYAQAGRRAVSVVVSENGVIDFCLFSDAMKEAKVRWLKAGTPVPQGTATARFGADRANVSSARSTSERVDLMDWFDCPSSHMVSEEVIGLGSYGKTLTILHSSKLTAQAQGHDDDEEEDDAVVLDRWTPRFHK